MDIGDERLVVEVPAGTLTSYYRFQNAVLAEHGRWFADLRVCDWNRPAAAWRRVVGEALAAAATKADEN